MASPPEGIITMQDMQVIFGVTDLMGIHRESVSVELTKEDPGTITQAAGGKIEITVPQSEAVEQFALRLRAELDALGYTEVELVDDEDDED